MLTIHVQLGGQKNLLEIELNESLRRRREELQSKIEVLGEADTGTAFSAEDYEARVRELKNLDNSIQGLRKKASGAFQYIYSPNLILY